MASRVDIKLLRQALSEIPPDDYRIIRDAYYDAVAGLRGLVVALDTIKNSAPAGSRRALIAELKHARNAQFELGESDLGEVL